MVSVVVSYSVVFVAVPPGAPRLIGPFIFSPVRDPDYWSEVNWSDPLPGISVRSKIVRSVVRDLMVVILSIFSPSIWSLAIGVVRKCSLVLGAIR